MARYFATSPRYRLFAVLVIFLQFSLGRGAEWSMRPTQQLLADTRIDSLEGDGPVCKLKNDLLVNFEQAAFFLKADCLQGKSSDFWRVNCDTSPCKEQPCVGNCIPYCCHTWVASLLEQVEVFNRFYSEHSRELFCGGKRC